MDLQSNVTPAGALEYQRPQPACEQKQSDQQTPQVGCADNTSWSNDWSAEEHRILIEELERVPATLPPTERYVLIACKLPRKTTRQVAHRAVWSSRKDGGKRRKSGSEESAPKRQRRDPVSRAANSTPRITAPQQLGTPNFGQQASVQPKSGGFVPAVGAITDANKVPWTTIWRLFQDNYVLLNQIKMNMDGFRVPENNELLSRFRDNLQSISTHMDGMKGVMGKMPQLPVRINSELAKSVLDKTNVNGLFSAFPALGPIALPMSPTPASPIPPIPFSGLFPGFIPCMMPGALPANISGILPPMSLASQTTGHTNVHPQTELNARPVMPPNPFVPLGTLSGNPQMGGMIMGPLAPGLNAGQQGIGLSTQGPPITRMASAPGSLCQAPTPNSTVLPGPAVSGSWNASSQWGNKVPVKQENLMASAGASQSG